MTKNPSGRRVATMAAATVLSMGALSMAGAGVANAAKHTTDAGTFTSRAACESAIKSFTATPVGGTYYCASNGNPASTAEPTYSAYYVYYD